MTYELHVSTYVAVANFRWDTIYQRSYIDMIHVFTYLLRGAESFLRM